MGRLREGGLSVGCTARNELIFCMFYGFIISFSFLVNLVIELIVFIEGLLVSTGRLREGG